MIMKNERPRSIFFSQTVLLISLLCHQSVIEQHHQMKVDDNPSEVIKNKNSNDIEDDNEQHHTIETSDINVLENQHDYLFRCAICGTAEGDSSNLSSNISLQTNATVRCGHQL